LLCRAAGLIGWLVAPRQGRELDSFRRKMKEGLLAGATIEPGDLYAESCLLPGRDPSKKNPDAYDLIVSYVS
jgi:hypothetical protein